MQSFDAFRGIIEPFAILEGSKLYTLLKDNVNLLDPEAVKEYIARKQGWSENTKFFTVAVYDGFVKYLGQKWEKPQYKIS